MAEQENKKPKKQKSAMREWWDSVLFAVVAATLIRGLFLEAYTIPTGSMEKSLLINDFLFVSKVHYGARTPKTILQIPLTHQKIWFTEIPSYSDAIQIPNFRLPGFTSVKNGDVVVFNYPGCPERPDPYGGFDKYPVDLRTNYIKRCIGIGGDVVDIRNSEVYVNNKKFDNAASTQKYYSIETNTNVNENLVEKLGIENKGERSENGKIYYSINSTESALAELKKYDFVTNIFPDIIAKGDTSDQNYNAFPHQTTLFSNNRDNFEPFTVPKKGMKIQLTEKNIAMYKSVITVFDLNKNAEYKNGKIFIDGKQVNEYTFNQDYYFMMGDNRYESDDSRFWGFVPADHIVGKAVFIWMSIDANGNLLNKIRWSRLFSLIK
ncbi:MAG: signal peptidase I [Leadbetterella sp.]|nr:signal peptidase I [Leadbetterella sp.]